ncbi:MAG: PilN domain-containing protein [Chromatiales bacterium]|nr:PilN domain-containing protein [Chromatiales bacterium]
MAHINLLPWRENRRRKRKRDFGVGLVAAIVLTSGVLAGLHWFVEGRIDYQKRRNKWLTQKIEVVDKQIAQIKKLEQLKSQLIARTEIIYNLQLSRPQAVHLFDEIVATLPEGVLISNIGQAGSGLSISGSAQSNSRVSAYMRNIEGAKWIGSPGLIVIESKDKTGTGLSQFQLRAAQRRPKSDDAGGES